MKNVVIYTEMIVKVAENFEVYGEEI